MGKKVALIFLLSFFVLINFAPPSTALFNNDVDKAKDFMQAGMYPQAIAVLDKRINDKPTDAEAHYQLGICYIHAGNYHGADERFNSAVRLQPEYGHKTGGEYKRVGSENLNKGRTSHALSLFRKAVKYQPNLKKEIAQECFSAGKLYLNKRQSNIADGLLSMAQTSDASLTEEIKEVEASYGNKLLEIAQNHPKKERKKYINEARKYLDQKTIDEVFPPPTWKTVFKKTYIGKGMGKNEHLLTAENGKDYVYGDKIIVEGNYFKVWDNGRWREFKGKFININKSSNTGNSIGVKTPKGKSFTVIVQRFITSY
jgi:tetratricopeptide (TPR) repeat protein